MLVFMIQWGGDRYHPGPFSLLDPLWLLGVGVLAAVLFVPLLERFVPRARQRVRARRRRRRTLQAAATAELRSRAVMSELCPHGWRAKITLFEHPDPDGFADQPRPDRVQLEWTELRDASGAPAVMRELWAPSVGAALEAMVADRRTDETLEQIELGAVWDGARWPEAGAE
ncbi:MAG: hypothetical protein ABI355_08085 [Solirubrobacteraceae bacterium]